MCTCATTEIHAILLTQLPALLPVPRAALGAGVGALRAEVAVVAEVVGVAVVAEVVAEVVGVVVAAEAVAAVVAAEAEVVAAVVAAEVVAAEDVIAPDLALGPVLVVFAPVDESLPDTPSLQTRTRHTARKSTLVIWIIGSVQRPTYVLSRHRFFPSIHFTYFFCINYGFDSLFLYNYKSHSQHCHACLNRLC